MGTPRSVTERLLAQQQAPSRFGEYRTLTDSLMANPTPPAPVRVPEPAQRRGMGFGRALALAARDLGTQAAAAITEGGNSLVSIVDPSGEAERAAAIEEFYAAPVTDAGRAMRLAARIGYEGAQYIIGGGAVSGLARVATRQMLPRAAARAAQAVAAPTTVGGRVARNVAAGGPVDLVQAAKGPEESVLGMIVGTDHPLNQSYAARAITEIGAGAIGGTAIEEGARGLGRAHRANLPPTERAQEAGARAAEQFKAMQALPPAGPSPIADPIAVGPQGAQMPVTRQTALPPPSGEGAYLMGADGQPVRLMGGEPGLPWERGVPWGSQAPVLDDATESILREQGVAPDVARVADEAVPAVDAPPVEVSPAAVVPDPAQIPLEQMDRGQFVRWWKDNSGIDYKTAPYAQVREDIARQNRAWDALESRRSAAGPTLDEWMAQRQPAAVADEVVPEPVRAEPENVAPPTDSEPVSAAAAFGSTRVRQMNEIEERHRLRGIWQRLMTSPKQQIDEIVDAITPQEAEGFLAELRAAPGNNPTVEAALARKVSTGTQGFALAPALAAGTTGAIGGLVGAAPEEGQEGVDWKGAALGAIGSGAAALGIGSVARAGLRKARGFQMPPPVEQAYKRAESAIDFNGALQKQKDNEAKGGFVARVERVLDNLGTGLGFIERLGKASDLRPSQNPRDLLALWRDSRITASRMLREGVIDPHTRNVVGPSMEDVVKPFEGDWDKTRQAFTYAVNKRLLGRGIEGFGGDARKMADAQALVKHLENEPAIQAFETRLREYTDGLGEYAMRAGLWTPEQWDAIRNSDALYIPTRRIMGKGVLDRVPGAAGATLANVASGVSKFTGSAREVYDPALALVEYTHRIIERADSYRVGHGVIEVAQRMGPEGEMLLTPVPRAGRNAKMRKAKAGRAAQALRANLPQDVLDAIDDLAPVAVDPQNPVVWRNGPNGREEYQINSPDLYHALTGLKGMSDDGLRQILDLTLLPLKRIFTATTTGLSLPFTIWTNPVRDLVETGAKTQNRVRPMRDVIAVGYREALRGALGKNGFSETMRRFGLGNVTKWDDATTITPDVLQREIAPTSRGQAVRATARNVALRGTGITLLESIGNATEMGPRLGEARASIRNNSPRVRAGEWDVADLLLRAGADARELVDFANRPGNAVLRELARYVPFFGAAQQGTVTMARAAKNNPKRVASVAAGLGVASAVAWALQRRSEDVRKRETDRLPAERAGYLFIPMDDAGRYTIRVPVPHELGTVHAGITAALDAWEGENPDAAATFWQSVARALPPIAGDLLVEQEFNPSIPGVQQVVENMRNRKGFSGAPVESMAMQRLSPAERRHDTTPATADLLAAGLRTLGFDETSPLQAENLLRGVTGRFTDQMTMVTDPIAERVLGREASAPKIPPPIGRNPLNPASSILANPNPSSTASQERYYALRTRSERVRADLKKAVEEKNRDRAERILAGPDAALLRPDKRQSLKQVDAVLDALRDNQDALRGAVREGKMDPAEARAKLNQMAALRAEVYRRATVLLESEGSE